MLSIAEKNKLSHALIAEYQCALLSSGNAELRKMLSSIVAAKVSIATLLSIATYQSLVRNQFQFAENREGEEHRLLD